MLSVKQTAYLTIFLAITVSFVLNFAFYSLEKNSGEEVDNIIVLRSKDVLKQSLDGKGDPYEDVLDKIKKSAKMLADHGYIVLYEQSVINAPDSFFVDINSIPDITDEK